MKTNCLFIFLATSLFFSVALTGCEKITESGSGFLDVELSGVWPFEIDGVKCIVNSTSEEIARAAYDPQGFTLRLPAVLPESSLVKINETIPDGIISDPRTKWQQTHLECYKKGTPTLGSAGFDITYIYADRPVTINGRYSEETTLNTFPLPNVAGIVEYTVTVNIIWNEVILKKGWNRVKLDKYIVRCPDLIEFEYCLPEDQDSPITWNTLQFDFPSDQTYPTKWIVGK